MSITLFRFVFAFLPGKVVAKIYALTMIGVSCSILAPFIIFNVDSEIGLIFASIIFGLSNSALFPLLLSLPP